MGISVWRFALAVMSLGSFDLFWLQSRERAEKMR